MTTFRLSPHTSSASGKVRYVDVQVIVERDRTSLIYMVGPDADALRFAAPTKPYRTDGLWRTTCFEMFVKTKGASYLEFNFSPSGEWAAYAFDKYRAGMRALEIAEHPALLSPPAIWIETEGIVGFALGTTIGPLPENTSLALTAVIEEADGTKSYWSLAHPEGPPDFHHPACFAARLPAPDAP